MKPKIAIIGCGWLGLPLAKKLIEQGFKVKGSTTSVTKIGTLEKAGILPFQITISENEIVGDIDRLLHECEIAIVNIPPGLRKNPSSNYYKKIDLLRSKIEDSTINKLLFISSTSVYKNQNEVITEKTVLKPDTQIGKQLLDAEQLIKDSKNYETTILRYSGLIGPDRHPVKFLSAKNDLKNGNSPVNLVHLEDCIDVVFFIINNALWKDEFNIAYPDHPTRASYYIKAARDRALALPIFQKNVNSGGHKIISSEKIQRLGFRFKKPI